jgi:hypothetical protein
MQRFPCKPITLAQKELFLENPTFHLSLIVQEHVNFSPSPQTGASILDYMKIEQKL